MFIFAVEELSIICPVSRTVNAADSQNIVLAQPTVTGAVGAVTFTYFVVGPSGSLVPVNNQQLSTTAPSVTTIVTFVEDQSGRPSVLCSYMITTNAAISKNNSKARLTFASTFDEWHPKTMFVFF